MSPIEAKTIFAEMLAEMHKADLVKLAKTLGIVGSDNMSTSGLRLIIRKMATNC